MRRPLLAAMLAATAFTAPATAASVTTSDDAVVFTGEIVEGDFNRFAQVITTAKQRGRPIAGVALNSEGGMIKEAAMIAGLIRSEGLETAVVKGDSCVSACVLIFAGGKARFSMYGARIGVHGAAYADGTAADDGTVASARMYKALDVPDAVITKMVTTDHDDVAWLTPDDIEGWAEIVEEDKPAITAAAPRPDRHSAILTCRSTETGNAYMVIYNGDTMHIGGRPYPITEHRTEGAWGPTKHGIYAVNVVKSFVKYVNAKGEEATDWCSK